MKMSYEVLKLDKELVAFPAFSGCRDRNNNRSLCTVLFAIVSESDNDVVLYLTVFVYLVLTSSVSVFFKGALVASAITRLRGGDPNVGSGLRHALRHIHELILWGIISAVVAMLIMLLRNLLSRVSELAADIVAELAQSGWDFLTFFVVPVIVSKTPGLSPVSSAPLKSCRPPGADRLPPLSGSSSFISWHWRLRPYLPSSLAWCTGPPGAAVFIVLAGAAVLVIQTLEGIFKAALYDFATGAEPMVFERRSLENAFIPA